MTVKLAISITLILLNIVNITLHSLGSYLLINLYQQGLKNSQQVYLINLSICELMLNILECLNIIPDFVSIPKSISYEIQEIQHYILIVIFAGMSFVFYMDMVYITLDRLLNVSYKLKYFAYWDELKAKRLLFVTWLIGLLSCVSISLLHYFTEYQWKDLYFKYIYPVLAFAFFLLALVTYSVLFKEYKRSYKMSRQVRHCRTRKTQHRKVTTVMTVFCKSRFIVSVLIIFSFLIFILVPDLVYLFFGIVGNNKTDCLIDYYWISYAVANMVDAFIYIFLTPSVNSLLCKKTRRLFRVKTSYKVDQRCKYNQSDIYNLNAICKNTIWVSNTTLGRSTSRGIMK